MDQEKIKSLYRQGYDCAQCVLFTMMDELECDEDTALRSVSCMSMGLLEGSVCGAVLGALAVIGLKYGSSAADMGSKGLGIVKRAQFITEFKKRYNGLTCPELMGLDVRNDEDSLKAFKNGVYEHFCPKMSSDITDILKGMMDG